MKHLRGYLKAMAEFKFTLQRDKKFIEESIEVNNNELINIKSARYDLISILKFEERYDQIIESHLEFKSFLHTSSLFAISNANISYISNHEVRSKLNRLVFNTLNLGKLYLDKAFHEKDKKFFVKDLTKDKLLHEKVLELRKRIDLENFGYKLCCKLRNYVQHNMLPINMIKKGINRLEGTNNKTILAHFVLPLKKDEIKSNDIRSKLLDNFDEEIDLHLAMDEYIYAISQMHIQAREFINPTMNNALSIFKKRQIRIEEQYGKSLTDISLYESDIRLLSLDVEWFNVVPYIQGKYSIALNYRNIEHNTYL
jgi:hypothetical protein